MKLIELHHKPWTPIDGIRRSRFKWLLKVYVLLTIAIGATLYFFMPNESTTLSAASFGSYFPGIRSLAIQSFHPVFIETFLSVAMITGWCMGIFSWFWLPSGSEVAHGSLTSKMFLTFCALLMTIGCASLLFVDNSFGGFNDGRSSAFLRFGASSVAGAVTVLNALFGLAPLFFMLTVKSAFTAEVDDRSAS